MVELQIAFVPSLVNLPPVDGLLDSTTGLVSVRAVGKAAVGNERAEFDEVTLEFAGAHAPELELAEPGGIDDIAARLEPNQLRGSRSCACPLKVQSDTSRTLRFNPGLDRRSAASSCRRRSGPTRR